jgi:hypothetical protein
MTTKRKQLLSMKNETVSLDDAYDFLYNHVKNWRYADDHPELKAKYKHNKVPEWSKIVDNRAR